jgi:hypothetical protein
MVVFNTTLTLGALYRALHKLGLGFLLALVFGSIELFWFSWVFFLLDDWHKILKEADGK